jgi:hypothetical protein
MFDWFKPKNKKNVVVPSKEVGPVQGIELIKQFTTEDEPKLANYPKEEYNVYWETYLDAVPGGYKAVVRFYPYNGEAATEYVLTSNTVLTLKQEVNKLILNTLEQSKK